MDNHAQRECDRCGGSIERPCDCPTPIASLEPLRQLLMEPGFFGDRCQVCGQPAHPTVTCVYTLQRRLAQAQILITALGQDNEALRADRDALRTSLAEFRCLHCGYTLLVPKDDGM